ncbi:histidine triad nucleotide-binding protein [Acidobacteria bacterium AB60]|nr:histidine triad nucleotide-binding protein [Acidobacteria bacterium AB60]
MDCLFCKIVAGKIPAKLIHDDEHCIAFLDINPQAPTHFLVVPREHVASLARGGSSHTALFGHLLTTASAIARDRGLANGYRVVVNTGPDGGQTVDHLHVHVLGGRHLTWPPG